MKVILDEMPVVRRGAKPFVSSLLESYWPEVEHPSNGLGSTVSFKIPAFRYVADLSELFALVKGWVITKAVRVAPGFLKLTLRLPGRRGHRTICS